MILMFCQQPDAHMTTLVEFVSIDCLVASDRKDDVVQYLTANHCSRRAAVRQNFLYSEQYTVFKTLT